MALESEEGNGGVSQGGEILWGTAGANPTVIFLKGHVDDDHVS